MPTGRGNSISVVIPALDEERGLENAVESVVPVLERHFGSWEIVIVDDGSTDRTAAIADDLAARRPEVSVVHNETPQGMGGAIRCGWRRARMERVMWVDAQGATRPEALDAIFALVGDADLVVPYAANQRERPWLRRTIATVFHTTLNLVFGLDVRQYTHLVVCDRAIARRLKLRTSSHAMQAEALIKLIRSGCSYVQVGVEDNFDIEGRKSKAFKVSNVWGVATFLFGTAWDVFVKREYLLAPADDRMPKDLAETTAARAGGMASGGRP